MNYWPVAEYEKEGRTEKIWTYDSSPSFSSAVDVVRRWSQNGYKITRAYVDEYNAETLVFRTQIDLADLSF